MKKSALPITLDLYLYDYGVTESKSEIPLTTPGQGQGL